ncbi:unnamed protein product [Paramecium pentaurelia]|uniref:Transmembrane protein n=1 Tax=Paramecium pentaurelia TaxID=43138 RepID=A0A8S1SX64_9CILI|nr:unnamed protein product [Paramecium pentaurelia]
MSERREEDTTLVQAAIPAALEGAKKAEEMEKKIKEQGGQKLEEAEKQAQVQILKAQEMLAFSGNQAQVAQQQSLSVAAAQYLVGSLLSMLILQLGFFGSILTFIPFLEQLTIILYIVSILIVQFCPGSVDKVPKNFGFCIVHSASKILLMVYLTIHFESIKFELIQLVFGIVILFLLFLIKNGISENQDIALVVKKQFFTVLIVSAVISGFLGLLTRSNLFITLILIVVGAGYTYYLQLALQRFCDHKYLFINKNDQYLGAAQLDADLFLWCKLVGFHCIKKNEGGAYIPNLEFDEENKQKEPETQEQNKI